MGCGRPNECEGSRWCRVSVTQLVVIHPAILGSRFKVAKSDCEKELLVRHYHLFTGKTENSFGNRDRHTHNSGNDHHDTLIRINFLRFFMQYFPCIWCSVCLHFKYALSKHICAATSHHRHLTRVCIVQAPFKIVPRSVFA